MARKTWGELVTEPERKKRQGSSATSEMRGYTAMIFRAIGETDITILREVEDTMRHVIFHSTLDWQDRETFDQGAREAYGIVRLQHRADISGVLPEDWATSYLLGVPVTDIPRLARQARA